MSLARVLAALALVAALSLVPVRPAGAVPILDPGDEIELANSLAEAFEEQGVCYGWSVDVQDDGGSASGTDAGSSLGPDRSPYDPACQPSVIFVARLHYTSELSEAADSASYRIESTLPGFETGGLGALGISESGLLGDKDDLNVFNATSLLPSLVAEQGLAPALVAEETTGTIPATDGPTGRPSSDRLRTYGWAYGAAGLLAVAGVGWLALALSLRAVQRRNPDFTLSSLLDEDD